LEKIIIVFSNFKGILADGARRILEKTQKNADEVEKAKTSTIVSN